MRTAYVTMMCGGDNYLPGVEALGRSLAESGTHVPRVVMVTPDVSAAARQQLVDQGWQLRPIDPVSAPADDARLFERFALSYSKLRVFDLVELDKVVFLDADTIVLKNIDELFDRPSVAAAPDFFMPDRFNSGVMVVDPSTATYRTLLESLGRAKTYDGGDQGLLNTNWPDWWERPAAYRLGAGYNLHHFVYQFMLSHDGLRRSFIDEIKVIHYTLQKPWQSMTLSGASAIWWDKFYGAHPEAATDLRRRLHALEDSSFDRVVGMLGGR